MLIIRMGLLSSCCQFLTHRPYLLTPLDIGLADVAFHFRRVLYFTCVQLVTTSI